MLKKLWNKKNDKKGFTLVELIVVLIILAILAALLIPALTGYIDKAKNKQIIAETRQAVMAAQTLADEEYAKGATTFALDATASVPASRIAGHVYAVEIKDLGDIPGTVTAAVFAADAKVTSLEYTNTSGKICTYTVTAGSDVGNFEVN